MKGEKETRKLLLASAKTEFMEKGYMKASLRNICKNAGVTTGALYFFFQDKEDLFASIVEEPIHGLYEIMKLHYAMILQGQRDGGQWRAMEGNEGSEGNEADDVFAVSKLLQYLYKNYDIFFMLLTKSQGSGYENIVDRFVEITEHYYKIYAGQTAAQGEEIPDYLIHWIAHMQIDSFVHMITHESSEEEALKYFKPIVKYMQAGWNGLFGKQTGK